MMFLPKSFSEAGSASSASRYSRGAYVGERPELVTEKDQWGVTVIGADVTVGAGAIVPARGMVEEDVEEVL